MSIPPVYVLGAGLSRAVSAEMPLLVELSDLVRREVDRGLLSGSAAPQTSNFEHWLSYLASDAPWLDEAGRLRNQAAFVAISQAVGRIVGEREQRARTAALPDWLASLVARWHEDQAAVITFNYDNLVEAAYTQVVTIGTAENNYVSHRQLQRAPITPIGSRGGAVLWHSEALTFELLKLHGSRSWVYSGRPAYFGEVIYDTCGVRGWAPEPEDPNPWLASDKVPLVVPPTSGKTGFFENETVRWQWRLAHERLTAAKEVTFVGYSFPESDLLVRCLLQQSLHAAESITVVDPNRAVADRVDGLLRDAQIEKHADWLPSVEELSTRLPPASQSPITPLRP